MSKPRRTAALLANFKGGKNELTILHGILCRSHGQDRQNGDADLIDLCFDDIVIARRIDELMKAAIEEARVER